MEKITRLCFVNNSGSFSPLDIVLFQRNKMPEAGQVAIAWKVLRNCAHASRVPSDFPLKLSIGASDPYANYTPQLEVRHGQLFSVALTKSGDMLVPTGYTVAPDQIDVRNDLIQGMTNAWMYRDGRLLGGKTNIAPGQTAAFRFDATLCIGISTSHVEDGQLMDETKIFPLGEIPLDNIDEADIVITGGGQGTGAVPQQFTLQNVVYAPELPVPPKPQQPDPVPPPTPPGP